MEPTILPQEFKTQFAITGRCLYCNALLRHEVHSYNHFMRYHACDRTTAQPRKPQTSVQRFFVWHERQWKEVGLVAFLMAQRTTMPVCCTKR